MSELPEVSKQQLGRMKVIKQLSIEADKAILPSTTKKFAKQALTEAFDIIEELIISNGRLMAANLRG